MRNNEVEVVLVGNELLKGERRDAHLAYIGNVLIDAGARVSEAHVVADDRAGIAEAVRRSVDRARVVIVSGGLGPTHDDITREGVADALELPLEFMENEWKTIEKVFASFGRKADDSNRQQAYFPKGAEPISNERGTAAGFVIERGDVLVAVLPGPPRELIPMMENTVLPRIRTALRGSPLVRATFRTTGIGESDMTKHVRPLFDRFPEFEVSSLPHVGGVDIVIIQRTDGAESIDLNERVGAFGSALRDALGDKVYGSGDETFEAVIGRLLAARGESIGIAESLTGGLIGKRFTDIPGSSAYMLADVVAYSNQSKTEFLGLAGETITTHGAVSEEVCREMAVGIRGRARATYGLATTGIAGPEGGSNEKPVGLTFYGVAWDGGEDIRHRVFPGTREDIRSRVAYATMYLLYKRLQNA